MHHSRLRGFIIDCETDDVAAAAAFWRAALGDGRARKPQGKYLKLDPQGGLLVEVQAVRHPSRVHLDLAADDVPAEAARLERLGATVVKALKNWTVMQAPTGHRFCVIRARRPGFAATANAWDD
jgi:predicted enzyme related to lactoylglutathione lyase